MNNSALLNHTSMGALPADCLAQLAPLQQVLRYLNGETIHQRGEHGDGLSIVLSGGVKMGNYGQDGRYFLSKILLPGESFGEFVVFAGLPRTHTAEAFGDTEIGYIPRQRLTAELERSPLLAQQLLVSLSTRLHQSLEALDDLKRLPLPARIAKALLILSNSQQSQENQRRCLPISQEQLAAQLGVSRISVSKNIKHLVALHFIALGYHQITIVNYNGMSAWLEQQSQTRQLG